MQKTNETQPKITLAKFRIAELSQAEQRLSANGDIDVKCGGGTSGDASTVAVEVLL